MVANKSGEYEGEKAVEERRKCPRQKCEGTFHYQVSILEFKNLKKIHSYGSYVDISEEGLGFVTDFALEAGYVIRILKESSCQPALIKWSRECKGKCQAGGIYV